VGLGGVVQTAVRGLDNSVDVNFYPTREAEKSHLKYRPLGLGVMGWADFLHKMGLVFDGPEAEALAERVQEFIAYKAVEASCDLAEERGAYPGYWGSLWSQGKFPQDTYRDLMDYRGTPGEVAERQEWVGLRARVARSGLRNGSLMAIAPTATISTIVGCSESIAPDYSNLYVYSTMSGEAVMLNEHLVRALKADGLWSRGMADAVYAADGDVQGLPVPDEIKARFKTAFQVDQFRHVTIAARRHVWVDQGQSLNLFCDRPSLKYLNELYTHAWREGVKSTYYLRTKGASRVEKSVAAHALARPSASPPACRIDDPSCEACT
jgi:ribonucleoside-diphosphate reductase alpha chain